jgi:lipid-A-disaccharide synthase
MQHLKNMTDSLPKLQRLTILEGQSHDALACADLALVASGTATLEAALFKCPMVIAYSMPWISWEIMRRQRLQAWVGLPNILCGEFVVPELLQSEATPTALAAALQAWMDQPERVQDMRHKFTMLHDSLSQDTSLLATHAIEKILVS